MLQNPLPVCPPLLCLLEQEPGATAPTSVLLGQALAVNDTQDLGGSACPIPVNECISGSCSELASSGLNAELSPSNPCFLLQAAPSSLLLP